MAMLIQDFARFVRDHAAVRQYAQTAVTELMEASQMLASAIASGDGALLRRVAHTTRPILEEFGCPFNDASALDCAATTSGPFPHALAHALLAGLQPSIETIRADWVERAPSF